MAETSTSGAFPVGQAVHWARRSKQDVASAFLERLQARGDIDLGVPGFVEGVCHHFEKLPTRYALDVNIDSLDVLSHKRLLEEARNDPATVSFAVRPVEVRTLRHSNEPLPSPAFPAEVRGRVAAVARVLETAPRPRDRGGPRAAVTGRRPLARRRRAHAWRAAARPHSTIAHASTRPRPSPHPSAPPPHMRARAALPAAGTPSAALGTAAAAAQAGVWVVAQPPGGAEEDPACSSIAAVSCMRCGRDSPQPA
jgi:hypothetical protein